jgi:hypothetical protein
MIIIKKRNIREKEKGKGKGKANAASLKFSWLPELLHFV